MSPGEWIALVALALSVVVPTLASWRASIRRGEKIDAVLDAIMLRLGQAETAQRTHEAEDDKRIDDHDEQLERVREDVHRLELRLTRVEEHAPHARRTT